MKCFYKIGGWDLDLDEIAGISNPELDSNRYSSFLKFSILLNSDFPLANESNTKEIFIKIKDIVKEFDFDGCRYLLKPVNGGIYYVVHSKTRIPKKEDFLEEQAEADRDYEMFGDMIFKRDFYGRAIHLFKEFIGDDKDRILESVRYDLKEYKEYLRFKITWSNHKSLRRKLDG